MTQEEARAWLAARYPAGRIALLERFVAILRAESERQSLIARSTFDGVWARHVVDCAQLVDHVAMDGPWLDVGSGGGLPGMVVAILCGAPVTMSEPRRKRVEFLEAAIEALNLPNAVVCAGKVQELHGQFAVVTARAVAPLPDILAWTRHLVSRETLYVLPRGRSWQEDVALARRAWHGAFHVEQSMTDPDAGIVLAHDVRSR